MSSSHDSRSRDDRLGAATEEIARLIAEGKDVVVEALATRYALEPAEIEGCRAAVEAMGELAGVDFDGPPAFFDDEADTTLAPPDLPTDYEIGEEIGRGGMGIVYRARQKSLDRDVAIKVLRPGELTFGKAIARFQQEARALAKLRHPHIVGIHDVGQTDGAVWFSMDLIDGAPLSELIKGGKVGPTRATKILRQVASAVAYVHENGLIHRDLKPQNILIDGKGDAFVTDFGLARDAGNAEVSGLTQSGQVLGTPGYMAPEQARGRQREIGEGTDVYALGAILYECLAGRAPFRGLSPAETLNAVIHIDPKRPSKHNPKVPRDLEIIALHAMAKEIDRRYPTVRAFLEDLERFEEGRPIRVHAPTLAYKALRLVRRHRTTAAFGAGVVAVGVIAFFVALLPYLEAKRSLEHADQLFDAGQHRAAALLYEAALESNTAVETEVALERFARTLIAISDEERTRDPAAIAGRLAAARERALSHLGLRKDVRLRAYTSHERKRYWGPEAELLVALGLARGAAEGDHASTQPLEDAAFLVTQGDRRLQVGGAGLGGVGIRAVLDDVSIVLAHSDDPAFPMVARWVKKMFDGGHARTLLNWLRTRTKEHRADILAALRDHQPDIFQTWDIDEIRESAGGPPGFRARVAWFERRGGRWLDVPLSEEMHTAGRDDVVVTSKSIYAHPGLETVILPRIPGAMAWAGTHGAQRMDMAIEIGMSRDGRTAGIRNRAVEVTVAGTGNSSRGSSLGGSMSAPGHVTGAIVEAMGRSSTRMLVLVHTEAWQGSDPSSERRTGDLAEWTLDDWKSRIASNIEDFAKRAETGDADLGDRYRPNDPLQELLRLCTRLPNKTAAAPLRRLAARASGTVRRTIDVARILSEDEALLSEPDLYRLFDYDFVLEQPRLRWMRADLAGQILLSCTDQRARRLAYAILEDDPGYFDDRAALAEQYYDGELGDAPPWILDLLRHDLPPGRDLLVSGTDSAIQSSWPFALGILGVLLALLRVTRRAGAGLVVAAGMSGYMILVRSGGQDYFPHVLAGGLVALGALIAWSERRHYWFVVAAVASAASAALEPHIAPGLSLQFMTHGVFPGVAGFACMVIGVVSLFAGSTREPSGWRTWLAGTRLPTAAALFSVVALASPRLAVPTLTASAIGAAVIWAVAILAPRPGGRGLPWTARLFLTSYLVPLAGLRLVNALVDWRTDQAVFLPFDALAALFACIALPCAWTAFRLVLMPRTPATT